MEHDVNINYMKLCSVSQSTENLEIQYLKIMCIYILKLYIHIYIPDPQKYVWAPSISITTKGATFSLCIPIFRHSKGVMMQA